MERIQLTGGKYADIKQRMTKGDIKEIYKSANGKDGVITPPSLTIRLNVIAWSLTDESGKPLPINARTLDENLSFEDGYIILSAIKRRHPNLKWSS